MQPNNQHLDMMAQQMGFPDYASWAAWNAHRQAGLQTPNSATDRQVQQQQQATPNFLQRLLGQFYPLQYVADKVGKVL